MSLNVLKQDVCEKLLLKDFCMYKVVLGMSVQITDFGIAKLSPTLGVLP